MRRIRYGKETWSTRSKKKRAWTGIHSSSKVLQQLKEYHILSEKYRILTNFKNVIIGVIVGSVMLLNGWIELESKIGQLFVATAMAILVTLMLHCNDEFLRGE